MKRKPKPKKLKQVIEKGVSVWCVDQKLRLLYGTVEEVQTSSARCKMVDQNINADKTPFEIIIGIHKLKIKN